MSKTYLITGTNRGLGYEFVKLLSENKENVIISTVRDPDSATDLQRLAKSRPNIKVIKLDASSIESINQLDSQLSQVSPDGIDVFIANAAFFEPTTFKGTFNVDYDLYLKYYKTNSLGPLFTFKALYPHLLKKQTRKIIFISSNAAYLTNFLPFITSAYGQSKVALNHSLLTLNTELHKDQFTFVAVHPGVITTGTLKKVFNEVGSEQVQSFVDQGDDDQNKPISPQEAARINLKFFESVTRENSGKFYKFDNGVAVETPW